MSCAAHGHALCFECFRAERQRQSGERRSTDADAAGRPLSLISPVRAPLSARERTHRERMLAFAMAAQGRRT
jgi:hypothetical protein